MVIPAPPPPDDRVPMGFDDGYHGDDGRPDDDGDLAALSDESYRDATWFVYRRRLPGQVVDKGVNPNAPIYVAKMTGALDLEELANLVGGGSFRVVGYRGGSKFTEVPIEIDRPRKAHESDARIITPGQPVPAVVSTPDASGARIDRLEAMLGEVLQQLKAPPAPQPMTFADVIQAAKLMQPAPAPTVQPDKAVVDSMVSMLTRGIELGANREGSGGTDWAAIFANATPLIDKLATAVISRAAMRRPVAQVRPVPPGRPASSAEVIEVPTPPAASEPQESVRMAAVVEALARAIDDMGTDNELDPAGFADSAETILNDAECAMLRMATVDGLMGELSPLVGRFPAFGKPQARTYVEAVLSALKSPAADAE